MIIIVSVVYRLLTSVLTRSDTRTNAHDNYYNQDLCLSVFSLARMLLHVSIIEQDIIQIDIDE